MLNVNAKPKVYRLYGLFDPRDRTLRYVGCTSLSLGRRLSRHWNEYHRHPSRMAVFTWFLVLESAGLRPQIELIHEYESKHDALETEAGLIAGWRSAGLPLLNTMVGGHADRSRLKMSRSKNGRAVVDDAGNRFLTAEDAARFHKISSAGIWAVLHHKCHRFKGRVFRYA